MWIGDGDQRCGSEMSIRNRVEMWIRVCGLGMAVQRRRLLYTRDVLLGRWEISWNILE